MRHEREHRAADHVLGAEQVESCMVARVDDVVVDRVDERLEAREEVEQEDGDVVEHGVDVVLERAGEGEAVARAEDEQRDDDEHERDPEVGVDQQPRDVERRVDRDGRRLGPPRQQLDRGALDVLAVRRDLPPDPVVREVAPRVVALVVLGVPAPSCISWT